MQWFLFIMCMIVIAVNFAALMWLGRDCVSWEVVYVMGFVGKPLLAFAGSSSVATLPVFINEICYVIQ